MMVLGNDKDRCYSRNTLASPPAFLSMLGPTGLAARSGRFFARCGSGGSTPPTSVDRSVVLVHERHIGTRFDCFINGFCDRAILFALRNGCRGFESRTWTLNRYRAADRSVLGQGAMESQPHHSRVWVTRGRRVGFDSRGGLGKRSQTDTDKETRCYPGTTESVACGAVLAGEARR